MSMILDSVAAELLPRATITEPKRPMSSVAICVMFANWATWVAASSALRSVAMSRPLTVREKSSSVPWASSVASPTMPSWPPSISISKSCSAPTGDVPASSLVAAYRLAYCSSVMSTVLRTPAKAVS